MRVGVLLALVLVDLMSGRCAGLKVIGAGFGRTGTKSLQQALQMLGFNCYHAENMIRHLSDGHLDYWYDVGTSEDLSTFNFSKIYDEHGYDATLDFPSCLYYDALSSYYPDAKIVLTVRTSPTVWYLSAKRVSLSFHPSLTLDTGKHLFYHWNPLGRYVFRSLNASYLQHFYDVSNEAATKAQYVEWIHKVKRQVPAEKLLVFNVEEGWGPLCQFLNVEVPDVPFPRAVEYMYTTDLVISCVGWLTVVFPLLLMACCVKRSFSRRKLKAA